MNDHIENFKAWFRESILIKLGVIAIIMLALLIPSFWIQNLIQEREGYQSQVIGEVSSQWSADQLVQGPVLVLPYKKTQPANGQNKDKAETTGTLYILPQNLQIKAGIKTGLLKKGIYEVTVYNSDIAVSGSFSKPEINNLGINPDDVLYDKARLVFSISDMKGLKNNPTVKIAGESYSPEPATESDSPFNTGLEVSFPLQKDRDFAFSYQLDIKGSNNLSFTHLGKTTDVQISSDWASPVFSGRYLPDHRVVTNKGFSAKWHLLYYNRPFPQQWAGRDSLLTGSRSQEVVFGVKMQQAVDQYRKITRTAKYAPLIILLTFVSLLLTELIRKERVHLFNYILIGAAMIVYYTLLLSFAEQIGYNMAYLLSSVATVALISTFTASLLKNKQAALLFAFILCSFYGFIFIIIQLEELSLLVGSIALFIIIATLMYFSRKINWDNH